MHAAEVGQKSKALRGFAVQDESGGDVDEGSKRGLGGLGKAGVWIVP